MNQLSKEIASADEGYSLPTTGMAPGLAIMFNDRLFDRCKQIAGYMAKAEGFTPPHLLGKSEACFAVVTRAITWKLDPFAVMQSTYQTPGGKVGFEGKLVQAILENSGRLEGNVEYELFGDWNKIRGKFKKAAGQRGGEYYVSDWKPEDEDGLGVIVSAQIKGESKRRELEFFLKSAWPRNSTLWALRPEQQIKYTACRAFGNTIAPGILMGVPFDSDADQGTMIDVTPSRPSRSDFDEPRKAAVETPAHDKETGELVEETGADLPTAADVRGILKKPDNPMPEFSAADTFEMGREARKKGTHRKATPPEWRNAEGEKFIAAWLEGWDAQNTEQADARAGAET